MPLPQVSLAAQPAGGVTGCVVSSTSSLATTTTATESLTTPVLSLTTPNIFSSLPPIFSSLIGGDFPFNQPSAPNTAGGGGGGDSTSAALVAFPVSIQPSATSGSSAGNLILQAQNMGQPFLLTPTYDSRQNSLFASSQSYSTPPTSSLTGGLTPNIAGMNLEQLKLQYERTQQMIQQQLLYTQMQMLQQQQDKDAGVAEGGVAGSGASTGSVPHSVVRGLEVAPSRAMLQEGRGDQEGEREEEEGEGEEGGSNLPQYINGSDVMIGSRSQSQLHVMGARSRSSGGEDGDAAGLPPDKKARLDTSTDQ